MEMKVIREDKRRGKQDYKRLELVDTKSVVKVNSKVDNIKKVNMRKSMHLSVLDKVKGLTNDENLGEVNQVEIALRLWTKGFMSEKGGDGRSIQIVNKGKRKKDRGVNFVKECDKDIKERTGSYTRLGWKDIKGRRRVNQALNKRDEQPNWKRRGRGRREIGSNDKKRRWLNIDLRNQNQVKEIRKGISILSDTSKEYKNDGARLAMLKEIYRRVVRKGLFMQIWSMMLRRGTVMENEEKKKV